MRDKRNRKIGALSNILIVVFNVVLMAGALWASYVYTRNMKIENHKLQLDSFCSTVESMKQISENYLNNEKGYVNDWAAYISSSGMTREKAIEYIAKVNTQPDRSAHIVDMDDFSAITTYWRNGISNWTSCYEEKAKEDTNGGRFFINMMKTMFEQDDDSSITVLGKYRVGETQQNVISVGKSVVLDTGDGDTKSYLLLRVIPVDSLKDTWIFPTEYSDAEIGIITNGGEYIIQSQAMKSKNFLEFIRGYNFQDNYNKMQDLEDTLNSTDNGLLMYKNSKEEDCFWYYSAFEKSPGLDIIGYIPAESLGSLYINWFTIILICGALLLILIVDIIYILNINRRLHKASRIANQASLAKTRFLSSMSHDIRTPMNAVIGMTDIALKHIDDKEYVKKCLENVSSAGNHLITLINDILDISQVESGKMILNPAPFSVKNAVNKIENIFIPKVEEKKLDFKINVHDIEHDSLVADELRLNQICINLLNNAVKYTGENGHVVFDVSEENIADKSDFVRLVCVIADSGIGMSEEFQAQMYGSFEREKDSRIDKIQGSGLGLAIVKQLVDLMGGTIVCDSVAGEGTRFTVKIDMPVSKTEVKSVKGHTDDVSDDEYYAYTKGMHVLVAEDNDINWEIINTMLEDYDIVCDRAEDGSKCVDKLENSADGEYDVILMDIQMPVMSGKQAARLIRNSSREYVKNIPIYAMTADAFAEDVKECMECGMNGHIAKPVDIKKVLGILKKVHDNMEGI